MYTNWREEHPTKRLGTVYWVHNTLLINHTEEIVGGKGTQQDKPKKKKHLRINVTKCQSLQIDPPTHCIALLFALHSTCKEKEGPANKLDKC